MNNSRIFVDEQIHRLAEALEPAGEVKKFNGRELNAAILKAEKPHALFVRSATKVNNALLDGSDIKFIATATSGTDHIDEEYLYSKNIKFASAPGSNANSVAEYVVYSALKWSSIRKKPLKGMTAGIVGYGNVGKLVAKYFHRLGMQVLVNDPPLFDNGYEFPDTVEHTDLMSLFEQANVATLHIPLTDEGDYATRKLIIREYIDSLINGSLFVNTSRGGIVNETPLLQRLEDDEIYAAIDVWDNEPLVNTALAVNSILATPHIAGYSYDGKIKGALANAEAYKEFCGCKVNTAPIEEDLKAYKPLPPSDFAKEAELMEKLRESRKLEEDHEAFLETLSLGDSERRKAFDMLRKEYPVRREIL